jgi:hypothetical protein
MILGNKRNASVKYSLLYSVKSTFIIDNINDPAG